MNELQAQKLLVDAVNRNDGFAYKCSHKFISGVADVFVKYKCLPNAAYIECKLEKMPTRKVAVKPDLTELQQLFLRKVRSAGLTAGVCSFLYDKPTLFVAFLSYDQWVEQGHAVNVSSHEEVENGAREITLHEKVFHFIKYAPVIAAART